MSLTLVTGGSGFLGRHLLARLRRDGRPLRVLARPASNVTGLDGCEVLRGDVASAGDLRRALAGVSRVFHLAAETRDGQPRETYRRVNVDAVATLLDLCTELGVERVVHTSSYFAIGRTGPPRNAEGFVADEYWTHDPGDMHDEHELSKYDAEHPVNQHVSLGHPVLALMPTMMYGPELRPVRGVQDLSAGNRIVRMLAEHAAGRYGNLPGDGRQLWNLVHVEDVAAAHVAAMDAQDAGGKWPPPRWSHWHLLLGGENVAVQDLWAAFAELSGTAPPRAGGGGLLKKLFGGGAPPGRGREREAMDSHSWAYTSAMAGGDFGYSARPFRQGLQETVAWMKTSGLLGSGGAR
ncbi:MAG: NAD-dependent epimerase/dehydratase family protein [Planctomycetes bacterium]|nr:NAD-dependent epimerase/dehydratase family protein [Planctomycetota bacterium]